MLINKKFIIWIARKEKLNWWSERDLNKKKIKIKKFNKLTITKYFFKLDLYRKSYIKDDKELIIKPKEIIVISRAYSWDLFNSE